MTESHEMHAAQIAFWNGPGGEVWVARQARMDAMLAGIAEAAVARAAVRAGETVLDIGCGAGATSVMLAQAGGVVTGLDVSRPLLEVAQQRSKEVTWVLADAARHAFAPETVDVLFSRFGVMFFGHPEAAFGNLRQAMRPTGRVVFACWRPFNLNHWMAIPLGAVQSLVPAQPRPGPEEPGPFAFGDPARVTRIMVAAGFAPPRFSELDLALDVAGGEGLEVAVAHSMAVGPATRALQDQPESVVQAAREAVRAALAPYQVGQTVRLPAAIWLVETTPLQVSRSVSDR